MLLFLLVVVVVVVVPSANCNFTHSFKVNRKKYSNKAKVEQDGRNECVTWGLK